MYNKFFSFKEKPFKQAPNPENFFLSKSHEKTLTQLLFAISHGEGFVRITGEAGTGKTTLCKAFLGNLDASTEAAYISDPKLDELQFLKTINDAFGINSRPGNTKDLIDILNGFLIKKKAAGQKVLLLIDEAHDFPLDILEQHNLFSNPETDQEKLLQIILVGQPELINMLSSEKLRQLGQRITKKCQLEPLTFLETMDYIRHHLSHASRRAAPSFDKASCRIIYEYSLGIPQQINIGCDMALLNAYNHSSLKITGAITREAIKELTEKTKDRPYKRFKLATGLAILSAVLIPLIIILLYLSKVPPPEFAATHKTVNSPKILASSELIDPAAERLKIPEKPLVMDQDEPGENISGDMDGHSVHVGTFATASQANWRLKNLKSFGFPSFMYTEKGTTGNTVYVVVAGNYKSYELAEEASRSLSEKGHYNFIAKPKDALNQEPPR